MKFFVSADPMRSFGFRLLAVIGLIALVTMPGSANAQTRDLVSLKRSIQAEQRTAASLLSAVERQRTLNQRIANRLGTAGASTPPPTIEDLRQAQFEVDIARTRLLNLVNSRNAKLDEVAEINGNIVRLSANRGKTETDTLQNVVDEAALELYGEWKKATEAIVEQLTALEEATVDAVSWRQEQLAIAQTNASLETLVEGSLGNEEAQVNRIRELVQELGERALSVNNSADTISEANQSATAGRNALRVRADELTLRANARLTDIPIVQTRGLLNGVKPLVRESAVPVRIFEDAIDALDARATELDARLNISTNIREAIDDLGEILREGEDEATGDLIARLNRLRALIDTQRREIDELKDGIGDARESLLRERAARERTGLFTRETARTDRYARARLAAEIEELPDELTTIYQARLAEVETAFEVAPPRQLAIFGAVVVLALALTIYLRQRLLKRFIKSEATKATEIPLEVLRRNLFWLYPVAVWMIFTEIFAISASTASAILMLLIIPAAAASLTDLTYVIVMSRRRRTRIGTIITRATGVAMVLTAVVVFAYFVVNEAPLLPSTQLAINRLAYSVFVLAGLPMLLFVIFFAQPSHGDAQSALRGAVGGFLALLPPAALIATGAAGLAGYRNLAVIMLEDLAVAIGIAAILALLLGVLNDIAEGIALRIRQRDPAQAFFMRQNFIQPGKRLGQAVLIVIAIMVASQVFEWTTDTVVIADIFRVWQTPLFTAGGTTYSLGNAVIAIAAFVFVFWIAAWSRRVAYSVFLQKVKDIGIRQSLSVFAQYVVIVIGVLITLSAIGFDVTTLTVFAASLGVGIGFGLQNVVNNFISGLLLLVERPLRLGDIVTVGGASGTVSQIGIRSMRLRTFDEFDLIVPNSALVSDTFTNWTRSNSVMRVILGVGISYEDPPQKAVQIVEDILNAHTGVVRSPAPMVTVDEFGASSVDLRVCYYIDLRGSQSGFRIRSEILTAIRDRFGEAGISIPFPQRDVHFIAPKAAPQAVGKPAGRGTARVTEQAEGDGWQADAIEMVEDSDSGPGSKDFG